MTDRKNTENRPVVLDPEMKAKALQALSDLRDQTGFLAGLVAQDTLREDSVRTHMSLLRHQHDDLAQCFGTDVLSSELEDAYASCRKANARIAELEREAAEGISTRDALSRMRLTEEWLQSWYTLCGFQYARLEWNSFGICAEFSSDVDKPDSDRVGDHTGDRAFKAKVAHLVPFVFDSSWDLREDSFHDEILDTERNRHNVKDLVREAFPDARITKISSRLDRKDYLLRFEADFSWEDIERWHDRMMALAEKDPSCCGGAWFARLSELAKNLSDKSYKKYAPPGTLKADRKELDKLEAVTGAWKGLLDAHNRDASDACSGAVTVSACGASRSFPGGTPYSEMAGWLAEAFCLDVHEDLAGCRTLPWESSAG